MKSESEDITFKLAHAIVMEDMIHGSYDSVTEFEDTEEKFRGLIPKGLDSMSLYIVAAGGATISAWLIFYVRGLKT